MGIPKLKSYINQHFHGWHHEEKFKGQLVVDGNMVRHKLRIDWSHGGQFNEFHEATIGFYNLLLKCGVTPIVVLDGIDYTGDKWDTIMSRKSQCIEQVHEYLSSPFRGCDVRGKGVFPSLGMDVYVQVLDDLGIKVVATDGDADSIAVEIANFYNCPVLSDDSDFFLFRLEGGYIPMDKIKLDQQTNSFSAKIYYYREFCEVFFRDPNVRLIVPALVGNDFMTAVIDNTAYKYFIDDKVKLKDVKCHYLRSVIRYLYLFKSTESFMKKIIHFPCLSDSEKEVLTKNCERSIKLYNSDTTLEPADILKRGDICGKVLPRWFVERYRAGHISKFLISTIVLEKYLFDTAVDDTAQESPVLVSRRIRRYIYGIIGHDSVNEIFRVEQKLTSEIVTALISVAGRSIPLLDEISLLSCDEKSSIFRSILRCNDTELQEVEDRLRMVLAATVFWCKESQPPELLIKSLLFCFSVCSLHPEALQNPCYRNSKSFRQGPEWMRNFHYFAQWQCCFKDAIRLNQILKCPFTVTSPAFLYDGRLVMHLTESRNLDEKVDSFHVDSQLYQKLCRLVL